MQDEPTPTEMLEAVAHLMRDTVMPEVSARTAFLVRVAANAIDLVKRQIEKQPGYDAAELRRLQRLLKRDGGLADLNQALCDQIEAGKMSLETPGLGDHLWKTTMEKLAVDQPTYGHYVTALAEQGGKV